jgi:hypothetical protein
VNGSNLSHDPGYPDLTASQFSSVSRSKFRVSNWIRPRKFFPQSFPVISHLIIRRREDWMLTAPQNEPSVVEFYCLILVPLSCYEHRIVCFICPSPAPVTYSYCQRYRPAKYCKKKTMRKFHSNVSTCFHSVWVELPAGSVASRGWKPREGVEWTAVFNPLCTQ